MQDRPPRQFHNAVARHRGQTTSPQQKGQGDRRSEVKGEAEGRRTRAKPVTLSLLPPTHPAKPMAAPH